MNYFLVALISFCTSLLTVWLTQGQLRKAFVAAKDNVIDLEHKIKHLLLIPHDHKDDYEAHQYPEDRGVKISIYLSRSEIESIRQLAEERGSTIGDVLHSAIIKEATRFEND